MAMTSSSPSFTLSQSQQEQLIQKLEIFKVQGRDKCGRKVLFITGKLFPARLVSVEVLNKYLADKVFPSLGDKAFSVVYVNTGVKRSKNFPGISVLRSVLEAIPISHKAHLEAVYFLHPGLQSRLFLTFFGRLLFTGGLYWKVKYVNRLEFLWDHVRRNGVEIPEFVYDHEEELEYRPVMDYGLESDHPRPRDTVLVPLPTALDSSFSMYSMRCIA